MPAETTIRGIILAASGIGLLIVSIYFFITSISLLTTPQQNVTASLLAALIGFSLMSGGVTLLRSWAIARVAEKTLEESKD